MATKIAIVEDDRMLLQMYSFKFKAEGYVVIEAENGKIGLEVIEKQLPDIILLDIMMPEMNGDEMLAKMRDTEWGKNIKVIILTNVSEQEIPDSVLQHGIAAIIMKANTTPNQVIDMVREQLAK
jgi:CheY-like chemotaxis protein